MAVSKSSIVIHFLVKEIFTNHYSSGDSLMGENELAKQLNVSRTSIRSALQALSNKGIISIVPKSGSVVNPSEDWNWLDSEVLSWTSEFKVDVKFIYHLMVTRLIFEPNVAAMAALNASAKDLALIEESYEMMAHGVAKENREIVNEGDINFHRALLAASHNPFLITLGDALTAAMKALFEQTLEHDVCLSKPALAEHYDVMDAVRMRNSESARSLMRAIVLGATKKTIGDDADFIKYIK